MLCAATLSAQVVSSAEKAVDDINSAAALNLIFTTLDFPGSNLTGANGNNNSGEIVGAYTVSGSFVGHGFFYKDGKFTIFPLPHGHIAAYGGGINNFGDIAGSNVQSPDVGFYAKRGSPVQILIYPGSLSTFAVGINDNRIVVGAYYIFGNLGDTGFVYMNGKYISINYPGAVATFVTGINNSGQIVGTYNTPDWVQHGFTASHITPASFQSPNCCVAAAAVTEK